MQDAVDYIIENVEVTLADGVAFTDGWYINTTLGERLQISADTTFGDIRNIVSLLYPAGPLTEEPMDIPFVIYPNFTYNANLYSGHLSTAPDVYGTVTFDGKTSTDGTLSFEKECYSSWGMYVETTFAEAEFTLTGATAETDACGIYENTEDGIRLSEIVSATEMTPMHRIGGENYYGKLWYTSSAYALSVQLSENVTWDLHLEPTENLLSFLSKIPVSWDSILIGWFIGETQVTEETTISGSTTVVRRTVSKF